MEILFLFVLIILLPSAMCIVAHGVLIAGNKTVIVTIADDFVEVSATPGPDYNPSSSFKNKGFAQQTALREIDKENQTGIHAPRKNSQMIYLFDVLFLFL